MKCLKCKGEKFKKQKLRFSPEIKGEILEVVVPTYVCNNCEEPLMDSAQMNSLRRATADQYRQRHQLLTSKEIINLRENLGMSQAEFARYLKVGEASIKRWETYFIQDESQDENIRLKTDEAAAERNALDIHWKNSPADVLSGHRKFNFELFKNVVLELITYCKSPLFINKALFYVDFLHYKQYGTSMTGSRYVALEYGPCPDQYQGIFQLLVTNNVIEPLGKHDLVSKMKVDETIFDDREKDTLKKIIKLVKADGGKKLYKRSHDERAFKDNPFLTVISYDYAKDLLI